MVWLAGTATRHSCHMTVDRLVLVSSVNVYTLLYTCTVCCSADLKSCYEDWYTFDIVLYSTSLLVDSGTKD